jgi:hypothetical protein
MIAPPLRGYETAALHLREEGRQLFGKNGPTRRIMNGEIECPRLQIPSVKWQRTPRVLIFTPASVVALAMLLRPVFWPAHSQPFGSQLVG